MTSDREKYETEQKWRALVRTIIALAFSVGALTFVALNEGWLTIQAEE